MKFIKDDKKRQNRLEKIFNKMKKFSHVAVGILQDKKIPKQKFSLLDLAMVHEYGSKDGKIPQRSFFRSTLDSKSKQYVKFIENLNIKVIEGKLSVWQALTQIGEVVSKDMAQAINNGLEPKLKISTIKRKKSSKPLIDTGRLKGSITHEVLESK